ncbi:MAG: CRISPR-associated protein Csx3 [Actinobacteria bacterium]|nr:CRISPR-associated protein Csx3 [Actinomycetota bacterium]
MAQKFYRIALEGDVLKVAFGEAAQNDQIVAEASTTLAEMTASGELAGGPIVKINGPASLPVAVAIAHAVGHLYETVAVFDPKLGKYVVAVSHGTAYKPGDLID